MVKVLFVCLGNICRSPTAEGVFRHLIESENLTDRIKIDSAGTGAWHVGEEPDRRSQAAALRRGVDLSPIRARKTAKTDFDHFDYILAMDQANLDELNRQSPQDFPGQLGLFLNFAEKLQTRDVPDPYYGGGDGFEHVLDLIEAASIGLLADIHSRHLD